MALACAMDVTRLSRHHSKRKLPTSRYEGTMQGAWYLVAHRPVAAHDQQPPKRTFHCNILQSWAGRLLRRRVACCKSHQDHCECKLHQGMQEDLKCIRMSHVMTECPCSKVTFNRTHVGVWERSAS